MTKNKTQKGFTLIEMIGVLAIIGILAAVVAPRVIESIRDAKVTSAISSVNAAKTAVLNYYQRYDRIPLDGDLQHILIIARVKQVPHLPMRRVMLTPWDISFSSKNY